MPTSTDLDPEVKAVVERFSEQGIPEWHTMSVAAARRVEDEAFAPGSVPEIDLVRDLAIPGPDPGRGEGDDEIPLRIYRPDIKLPASTLLFFHGGGWVLGTLDSVDEICRHLADRGEVVVVSVDYSLAPEHPFPAATDDCWRALRWVKKNAPAFGGDASKIGVGGTSAGANLAAATALRSHAFDGPSIVGQLLAYPITNHAFDTESYRENADGPLLSRTDMEWFWDQYLRSPVDGHNPFASPLQAPESMLSGTPPATVLTAGFDPLCDEGRAYVERLESASVPVTHHHYPGLCHGFLSLTDEVETADRAMDDAAAAVRSWTE